MTNAPARRLRCALVTGGTGFIGGAIVERLRQSGTEVTALVRPGKACRHLEDLGARVVIGDITQPSSLPRALDGVDTVFHAAALVSPPYLLLAQFRAINRDGTANLIAASFGRIERFIHVSTVSVVGTVAAGELAGEDAIARPADRYGTSKLEAEQEVKKAAERGFPSVIARPMWTYGPHSRAATRLLQWLATGRFFLVGAATNTIQPVWIDDLIDGLLRCATVPGIEGNVYHLAGPEILTTGEFCRQAAVAVGVPLSRVRIPMWTARVIVGALERTLVPLGFRPPLDANKIAFFRVNHGYSIDRAARDLGWVPQITWQTGVARMVASLRASDIRVQK